MRPKHNIYQGAAIGLGLLFIVAGIFSRNPGNYYRFGIPFAIFSFLVGIINVKNIPVSDADTIRATVILTWTSVALLIILAWLTIATSGFS